MGDIRPERWATLKGYMKSFERAYRGFKENLHGNSR